MRPASMALINLCEFQRDVQRIHEFIELDWLGHIAEESCIQTLLDVACTEADVSEQHIGMARKLDMDTVGFLMMGHMSSPEKILEQARLMESYGANCIYARIRLVTCCRK